MRRLLLLSLTLIAPATPLVAQSFDVVKVTEGVFAAIPKAGIPVGSNGAFVVNDDDVLVVDTHYRPSYARELLAEIKKVTPLPVRYVVNTHWHNDHVQGNQAYVNVWPKGVEFLSHVSAREDIVQKAIPSIKDSLDAFVRVGVVGRRRQRGSEQQGGQEQAGHAAVFQPGAAAA